MWNHAGIYRIVVNRKNGPPMFYIGQAAILRKRRDAHFRALRLNNHKNIRLQRAVKKYGFEAVSFQIVLVCERSKNILDHYEKAVLDSYDQDATFNMNRLCVGSRLGLKSRPETTARISASNKGRPRTQSQRDAVRESNKRRTVSKETRAKMSASRMGNKNSLGKRLSAERKAEISEFFRGKKKPSEEIARRSLTRKLNRARNDTRRSEAEGGS